jgi:hypothetical protein
MSVNNAAAKPARSPQQLWEIAERLAKSGPFENATAAQLYARILVGDALGIDASTACSCIGHSKGKLVVAAGLQASLLARSDRYHIEVEEVSDERAAIRFFRDGKHVGTSVYTMAEAKHAGLASKDVWAKYPSDLLFARALTRGIRRYAPDLLVGNPAITLEEMGADLHEPIKPVPEAQVKAQPETKESATMAAPQPPPENKPARGTIADQQLRDLKALRELLEIPIDVWRYIILAKRGVRSATELSTEQAAELISALKTKLDVKAMEEGIAARDRELSAQRHGDLVVTLPANNKGKEVRASSASKRTN